ncbi:MAG TPA: integration host factor subunit beta [Methylococcaceae bacterium]|nr:integration host factor subunit beta [Methylococcaceae bacterium]
MIKSELITTMAHRRPHLPRHLVEACVNRIIDEIIGGLAQGNSIEVRGFGTFSLRFRQAQMGRNPKTGNCVHIASRHVVHFKTAKDLKKRVNELANQYPIQT